jgi:phosphoenolpyruvate carboxylase
MEATEESNAATVTDLVRALTVHFHLINLAEERQRARSLLASGEESAPETAPTHASVFASQDAEWPDVTALAVDARERLSELRIHPVLTAHPTEARRRAVASALSRITEQLDRYDDVRRGPAERAVARRRMLEEIEILHLTSPLRSTRPEPSDEVSTVMTVFDQTLFRAVPRLYRAVEAALARPEETPGRQPPMVPAFVRFGTWVGGDRDGNPFVTAEVTRQTVAVHADHVLRALYTVTDRVARTLTMDTTHTPASAELLASLADDAVTMPSRFAEITVSSPGEPHRQKMLVVSARLADTRAGGVELAYTGPQEVLADLRLVQRSLAAAGASRAAYGELQHVIWQVETFGFHLAELEIRQHSSVHTAALVELLGQLGSVTDPESAATDEAFLDQLALSGWPEQVAPRSDRTREVLDTLRVMAWLQRRWGQDCCGRYIISFSRTPADLVAVRALARLAVGNRPLRLDVVPLFETGDDLRRASQVMEGWTDLPSTKDWLSQRGGAVEIMLGYSDSAKDVGPTSATLTLATAQTQLVAWAAAAGVRLTLFHGRGGSLGRGGGPVHRAILAQPPGSVAGRFKVTEQGEVIFARYSDTTIAQRHLERLTASTLLAGTERAASRNREAAARYADLGTAMERASREAYLALVTMPGFADLVAQASPLEELGEMLLGSRPARRSGATTGRDLADFRAIPWVFAWSQTRLNLPGWYGLGTALSAVGDLPLLREAYQDWPLFSTLVDVAEMSLAKTNRRIGEGFLSLGGREDITARILSELDLTRQMVLAVLDQSELLERKPLLHTAVALRAPFIDALSQLQLRTLRALRAEAEAGSPTRPQFPAGWRHALLLTVNGAAAGLQNTG